VTLNQLRTFLAVADNESVHGAAQELVVTQAAVSASLAALQKGLGLALVAPDGRGLRLTDAGKAYAGYARRILGLLDEAGVAAAASADPERGELRIAAVTTAAEQVVPHILGGFRRKHPLTGIRLEAGNRDRVRSLLDRHQVDLVVSGRPEPGWAVAVHAVRPHQLVVVAAPDLAADAPASTAPRPTSTAVAAAPGLAASGPADEAGLLTWLARQTWLLREPGSGTRASTAALLAELDIAPLTLIVGSNGAIKESASVGLGVTLVSRDAVAAEIATGRLAELPVAARKEPVPAPAARLVEHVLETGSFRAANQEDPP
jgi:DNA-binding transcriptional LysR family regulator